MSGYVLTSDTVATCPHGGQVSFTATQTSVKISGSQALLLSDQATIAGCSFMIGNTPSPCLQVQWNAATGSQKAKVSGTALLLSSTVGLCVSGAQAPQGTVSLSTYQQRVQAQ